MKRTLFTNQFRRFLKEHFPKPSYVDFSETLKDADGKEYYVLLRIEEAPACNCREEDRRFSDPLEMLRYMKSVPGEWWSSDCPPCRRIGYSNENESVQVPLLNCKDTPLPPEILRILSSADGRKKLGKTIHELHI